MNKRTGMLGIILLVMTSLMIVPAAKDFANSEEVGSSGPAEEAVANSGITSFRSNEEILQAIKDFQSSTTSGDAAKSASPAGETKSSSSRESSLSNADYATTNVQVQGVDEADIVKTDGTFLYHLNLMKRELFISRAYPVSDFTILSRIKLDDRFQPREMFIDGKRIVVLGQTFIQSSNGKHGPVPSEPMMDRMYPPNMTTSVLVYETDEQKRATLLKQIDLSGNYISSRKISSTLYIASNQSAYIPYTADFQIKPEMYLPMFRDSSKQQELKPVDPKDIYHFDGEGSNQYLNIATINLGANILSTPTVDCKIASYLGGGQQIYMSEKNLYIARSDYPPSGVSYDNWTPTTTIYRFSAGNAPTYQYKGNIPGTLLNQFSMDEHNGSLRVATTKNQWRDGSDNNLYILDQQMNITGKIEGLAKGERIYSVRFMGDRGYVVTFKNTDPLFTIDLKEPKYPKVMGELKIPGFSNYLHPYDENHIIGFGRDTEEKDFGGGRTGVIQNGIKLSMFDVTDMANPKEMFTTIVGNESTYSELQHNHKALLFSKEKNLFAFPVQEHRGDKEPFAGYYLFGIDLKNGFVAKGTIASVQDLKHGFGQQRMLFIHDTLYLISDNVYKFNDLKTLQEVHSPLPVN